MNRVILHCDLNSFYASVELLYQPDLKDKPVAVGGDSTRRHGIILAKNPIAASYGVKTAETIWQARLKCPDIVILPANYDRYSLFSKKVRDIFLSYTDLVEPFGMDEAWLDVTHSSMFGSGKEIADEIRYRIRTELGITASVGVSYNKIFAKLASDMRKPDYTTVITPEEMRTVVWPLPVSDMLFVGKRTAGVLNDHHIFTLGDLAQSSERFLQMILGKAGPVLWKYANGNDDSPVKPYDSENTVKSIGNSVTGYRDINSFQDLNSVMLMLADNVATRLREQNMVAGGICVSLRDETLQVSTRQMLLDNPSDITSELFEYAMLICRKYYRFDRPLRSAGLRAIRLRDKAYGRQTSLFDNAPDDRDILLDKAIDDIRARYGFHSIKRATMMIDPMLTDRVASDD